MAKKELTGDELNFVSGQKESLRISRKRKFDEFYTQLPSVEAELAHYKKCFRGKVVYCNCDRVTDPKHPYAEENSAFYAYFREQFDRLGLKALLCSWYDAGSGKFNAIRFDGTKVTTMQLPDESDGSYDGEPAKKLLAVCDVVVTNPPFSIFKEYFRFIVQSGKPYLMVAPATCPTYKDVFPYLMNDQCRTGFTSLTHFYTIGEVPEGIKTSVEKGTGRTYVTSNCMWLTSLQLNNRPTPLTLWNTYEKGKFKHYDNLPNAIDVPSYKDIPKDWEGLIGTNVGIFTQYNPEQFKIWGLGVGNLMMTIPGVKRLSAQFVSDYKAAGGRGAYTADFPILGYYDDNIARIPFARVVVQLRKFVKEN